MYLFEFMLLTFFLQTRAKRSPYGIYLKSLFSIYSSHVHHIIADNRTCCLIFFNCRGRQKKNLLQLYVFFLQQLLSLRQPSIPNERKRWNYVSATDQFYEVFSMISCKEDFTEQNMISIKGNKKRLGV